MAISEEEVELDSNYKDLKMNCTYKYYHLENHLRIIKTKNLDFPKNLFNI